MCAHCKTSPLRKLQIAGTLYCQAAPKGTKQRRGHAHGPGHVVAKPIRSICNLKRRRKRNNLYKASWLWRNSSSQLQVVAYPSLPSPLQSVPPLSQPPPVHHFTSCPSPQQQLNLSMPTPSIFFNNVELVQISTVLFSFSFMTNV